ncbi:hypothetical protein BSZ39_00285 [Bowdeniella nasicola]|uniref:DUF3046 domain-containing protein n=1 Tax=Bowdeniella nasicola TaxID=208480 RepID=A0A1Q5Q5T8_9ACTO|nr:hypothetical protein BSZ39_00285 [Bowdeniella nasicola]
MRRSELFEALRHIYGEALGTSLAADLSLLQLGGRTIDQALADEVPVPKVWAAFCEEMGAGDEVRFYHRSIAREKRAGRA